MKTNTKKITPEKLLSLLFLAALVGCLFVLPCAAEDGEAGETFFSTLFAEIQQNAEAICSLLALGGSVIVAVLYKNGLHPLITRATGAIRTEVGNLKTATDETLAKTDETLAELCGKLTTLSDSLESLQIRLEKTGDIIEKQDDAAARAVFGKVLDEEVNLLYDIFMSTSLPQYEKDAVGERTAKMKREIASIKESEGIEN